MVGLTAKQSPEYIKDEHNFRDLKALLVFCAMHKSLGLDKAGGEGKYLLLNRKFKLYASCVLVLLLLPGQQNLIGHLSNDKRAAALDRIGTQFLSHA